MKTQKKYYRNGRNTQLSIEDDNGRQLAITKLIGSKLFYKDGDIIEKGKKVAEWDPYTLPVIAETGGDKLWI